MLIQKFLGCLTEVTRGEKPNLDVCGYMTNILVQTLSHSAMSGTLQPSFVTWLHYAVHEMYFIQTIGWWVSVPSHQATIDEQ